MPVFISYSEKDTAPYTSLCFALESEKVDYWNPKDMKAGISLKDQLKEAITKCDVCIFIVTRSSIDSKWCLAETGAFWGAGKRIILYVANPDIGQQKIPPLFQGDLQTCDVREVIRQSKEALSEVNKAKRAVEIQPHTQNVSGGENKETRFINLTPAEKTVLRAYIENGTRTQHLQYDDGVVVGLIRDGILYYASNRAVGYWDPRKLYTDINMELWAWQFLNDHPEFLAESNIESNKITT